MDAGSHCRRQKAESKVSIAMQCWENAAPKNPDSVPKMAALLELMVSGSYTKREK